MSRLLKICLLLVFLYIVGYPLYPKVEYHYLPEVQPQAVAEISDNFLLKSIQIPKMKVDTKLEVGSNEEDLDKGVILLDKYSEPQEMGNTVITAHRFLYTEGDKTFYHIDKMEEGDDIYINWEKNQYHYKVTLVDQVTPDESDLLDNDTSRQYLTLYSCAPLLQTTHRRVVQAELISVN